MKAVVVVALLVVAIAAVMALVALRRSAARFKRLLAEAGKRPGATEPLEWKVLLRELRALVEREPRTREALLQLEAESVFFSERLGKSAMCEVTPHFVWHFLSDADIRFKDSDYRRRQCHELLEWVTQMEREHCTGEMVPDGPLAPPE